jgi:electron transport complex protein RnfG
MEFAKVKEHPFYQPVLLGTMALLASASLSWASSATREAIAEAEARDLRDSLTQVLPAGFADNDLLSDSADIDVAGKAPLRVYRARKGKSDKTDGEADKIGEAAVQGVVFKVVGKGYGGEIVVLMAVDKEGALLGARVLKHTETPGLGDKIEVAKSNWINAFSGKSLATANWAVKKDGGDFDQFAGATITPRAVVGAIKEGLETFARHKAALLADSAPASASTQAANQVTREEPAK